MLSPTLAYHSNRKKEKNNILFHSKGQESEHVKELFKYKAIIFPSDELSIG